MIKNLKFKKRILILGLSYKKNIEDIRESASAKIFSKLRLKNIRLIIVIHMFKSLFIQKIKKA